MLFDLAFAQGFAKLAELEHKDRSITLPTIMNYTIDNNKNCSWLIGDKGTTFSMNIPPSAIPPLVSKKPKEQERTDVVILANFLMEKTIAPNLLKRAYTKTIKNISQSLETLSPDRAAIGIQPTNSIKFLQKTLETINDFEIKHIVITNLLAQLPSYRKIIRFLATIRQTVPIDTVLYLLSPLPPVYFPLFTYAGIDVFADSYIRLASRKNIYLTSNGGYPLADVKEQTCFCEACVSVTRLHDLSKTKSKKRGKNSKYHSPQTMLEVHNYLTMLQILREIRSSLYNDDLRSYIEENIQKNVFCAASLKLLDKLYGSSLIARTPTWSSASLKSISDYSFHRPAIRAFQQRMTERFRINKNKKVMLLLPCSATKPYSYSRSHQLFQSAIATLPRDKQNYIQELILTSPLGVIPRELERVYPNAHYDIPVSGDWSFEEKQITIKLLTAILSPKVAEKNTTIIAHVSNEYVEICKTVEDRLKRPFIYTAPDRRPTSSEAITELSNRLKNSLADTPPLYQNPQALLVRTLADYQFGLSVGKELYSEDIQIKGRPPSPFKVFDQKELVGVIHPASGQLTLSLQTGELLAKLEKYFVRFDGEQLRGSTLFAVGISNADEMIRPTDQVVILNKENLVVGVGEAIVSGEDMRKMTGGPAVKIKQKI